MTERLIWTCGAVDMTVKDAVGKFCAEHWDRKRTWNWLSRIRGEFRLSDGYSTYRCEANGSVYRVYRLED